MSPASPALAGRFFTTEPPGKPIHVGCQVKKRKTKQETERVIEVPICHVSRFYFILRVMKSF